MPYVSQVREDHEHRLNPPISSVAALARHVVDTVDLQSHVDFARDQIDAPTATAIQLLLNGLSRELGRCIMLLQERLRSLSPGSVLPRQPRADSLRLWQLFDTDGSDCRAHLESLLSGYVHYARTTSDSISILEMLGEAEGVKLLRKIFKAADRGIWFIEFYLEGLALHMDTRRLPAFTSVIDVPDAMRPGRCDGSRPHGS
jgi:DNA-binding ferritin-like protein